MLRGRLIFLFAFLLTPPFAGAQTEPELDVEPAPFVEEGPAEQPPAATDDFQIETTVESEPPLNEPKEETKAKVVPDAPVKIRNEEKLGPSRKIFDWQKYRNKTAVPHPFAEKGLIRINRERHYFYKMDPSEQKRAASLRFGSFYPESLENPDQAGEAGSTFDENYDQTDNPFVLFDYEWQMWRAFVGKLGLKVGTGVYLAQGNGHFVSTINAGLIPREVFTFVTIPVNAGAIYRFHFGKNKQLFVPYGEGGGTIFSFAELRDDAKGPKFGAAFGAYFGGGLAINLSYFDYLSRVQLDREYGINAVYLNLEYRRVIALSQNYDFSSDLLNGGFTVEF